MKTSKLKGFSLVELMVVVGIMGIAMGIAVPSLRSLMDTQKMKSATFDLVTAVMQTRSEATKYGTGAINGIAIYPAGGSFDNGWCTVFLTADPAVTANTDCSVTSPGKTAMRINAPTAGVQYVVNSCTSSLDASGNCVIRFGPNGRLRSGLPVKIQVNNIPSDASLSRCVTIDASGNASTKVAAC